MILPIAPDVKTLKKFPPICSYCKKIRDDENYRQQFDSCISSYTHTKFSRGICPECYETEVVPQLEKINLTRTD